MVDQFKIDFFERDHPGQPFPDVQPLTSDEIESLRGRLTERLGLPADAPWLSCLRHLAGRAEYIRGINAEDEGFDLAAVAHLCGIMPAQQVFLAWHPAIGRVDRIAFDDLARWFDDLWYPSSDDIEVFDETLSWFVLVHHSGSVSYARLVP